MKRITIHVEFVTPTFLGGARNADVAGWRAASIRGELRWWFRAVAGGILSGDLAAVHAREEGVFGSTGQASPLVVRALDAPDSIASGSPCNDGAQETSLQLASRWREPGSAARLRVGPPANEFRSNPIHYLGYGPILKVPGHPVPLFKRARIEAGQKATVQFQWDARLDRDMQGRHLLILAIRAWLAFGGIGARSRRGFGSVQSAGFDGNTTDVEIPKPSSDAETLRSDLAVLFYELCAGAAADLPEWSHFSSGTRVYVARVGSNGRPYTTWTEALQDVGAWLIGFRRRYGIDHAPGLVDGRTIGGMAVAGRDYNWAAPNAPIATRGRGIPDRAGFGLPLPFGNQGETVTWGGIGADNRRASPLLIHVSRVGAGFVPVLTYLPARLAPVGQNLHLKGRATPAAAPSARHDSIVGWFLDDLEAKGLIARVP